MSAHAVRPANPIVALLALLLSPVLAVVHIVVMAVLEHDGALERFADVARVVLLAGGAVAAAVLAVVSR